MTPDEIRHWRPASFADIAGETNQRRLRRLQTHLLRGQLVSPLLLVGIFGFGKTSVARLLFKSLDCERRDPKTADPCNSCAQCRCFGKYYHSYGHPYQRYEYDCTQLGRAELIEMFAEHRFKSTHALFMDELHHLHEKLSQEPLLKFVEDFDGILVAAVMEDRLEELIPPLRERFEMLHLCPPTVEEMVELFQRKTPEWGVVASERNLRYLVKHTGPSFRYCLKILAAAAEEDGELTEELIRDMLSLDDEAP